MLLPEPKNKNYCAVVVRIGPPTPVPNSDFLSQTEIFGMNCVMSRDTQEGTLGLFFPAETQLSGEFCSFNNLYRHKELNIDKTKTGFIDDNGRVRAIRLRNVPSSCLFLPLNGLAIPSGELKVIDLQVGDCFDELNGESICKKYVTPCSEKGPSQMRPSEANRVKSIWFPEHYDTENYHRNKDLIKPEEYVVITQKLHGTSIRIGKVPTIRHLTLMDRIAIRLGIEVNRLETKEIFGSRKVVKNPDGTSKSYYADTDLYIREGQKVVDMLPKNTVLYGELVGFTATGGPIQKDYTYDCKPNEAKLYVYRMATVTGDDDHKTTDWSWDAVKHFCKRNGLNHVVELARCQHKDFDPKGFEELNFNQELTTEAIPLSNPKLKDEGVVVRVDRTYPLFFKAKNQSFLRHETDLLDKGESDTESQG